MQFLSMTDCAALRVHTIYDSTFLSHLLLEPLAVYQKEAPGMSVGGWAGHKDGVDLAFQLVFILRERSADC